MKLECIPRNSPLKLYEYAIYSGAVSVTYAPQTEQDSFQDQKTTEEETAS